MPKKKQKKKIKSNLALANMRLKGMTFSWSQYDPLDNEDDSFFNEKVGHKNPVYRLMAGAIREEAQGLINKHAYKWKAEIEVQYVDDYGKTYYRGADVVFYGVLGQGDEGYCKAIEEVFNDSNMKHYVQTNVKITLIGQGEVKEEDFAA